MRKAILLLLITTLHAACTTTTPAAAQSSSNEQRVRSIYDAFARGDIPAVLGTFDSNIVWMEADSIDYADRNPYRGPNAILEGVFMRLGQDWNNFRVKIDQVVDDGDTVVTLGRYNASNKSTGIPLDAQFVHVWSLRDGKVIRFQQYTDTEQFARAAGACK